MKRSTSRREDVTPAQRYQRKHEDYWADSLFEVEWSSSLIIAGLEFPIVGGMLDLALDHAIATTVAMLRHPEDGLRWTADVAIVNRGKLLAIVRLTPRSPEVTRFDATRPLPVERILPGWRASRDSSLILIDASVDSTCYGLGIPLDGREPAEALDDAIRALCEPAGYHDPGNPDLDDVALSYRGRFLAVVRFTPAGPAVTRFDLPDFSSDSPAATPGHPEPPTSSTDAGGQDASIRSTSNPTTTLSTGATR